MRTIKIPTPILAALLSLLMPAASIAQGGHNQQTACPGWNNPTTFVTSNPHYYYNGQIGMRNNTVPDFLSGQNGLSNVSSHIAAATLHTVTTSALNHDGNLPLPTQRFAIMTDSDGTDQNTGDNLPYIPDGLSSSIRIGNAAVNEAINASILSYSMLVSPDNALLLLHHALVIQQPSHSNDINPFFNILVLRENGGTWQTINDTLAYFRVVNQANIIPEPNTNTNGWHTANGGSVYYKDWSTASIDLSAMMNQNVRIEITVAGCHFGTHWAYAYIAGECRPLHLDINQCNPPSGSIAALLAPSGMKNYRWLASNLPPADTSTFSPLTSTNSNPNSNTYSVSTSDFLCPNNDSSVNCRTFCCEITSELVPDKPITSQAFLRVCNTSLHLAIDSTLDCNGKATLRNLSQIITPTDTLPIDSTQWELYADADFSSSPFNTYFGDSITADCRGFSSVGILMRTFASHLDCIQESLFTIHPKNPPSVLVAGITHIYPGTHTNLTASSNTNCSFQWSLSSDSVSGSLPPGPHLRTIPHNDTVVYHIRAASLLNGCTSWDSITVICYDTSRHKILNQLFQSINIDTITCIDNQTTVQVGHSASCEIRVSDQIATLSHPERIFLPDGQPCGDYGCSYRSPVTFHSFDNNATVTSANDINHVRLNIEHSYIGDIHIGITCPNGQHASIMNFSDMGSSTCRSAIPPSAVGWKSGAPNIYPGTFFGLAFDSEAASDRCDSTLPGNAPGIGWNYCWSNSTSAGNSYAPGDALIYRAASSHGGRVDSSNVAARYNFYHPDDHFNALIGCPLNGTWYIEVIDGYSSDNGYVFDWELSLTATAIDSTVVITSSEIIGSDVARINDSTYILSAPAGASTDTSVNYTILLFDSIGIVADTTITIHYQAPSHTTLAEQRCQGDTIWVGSNYYTQDIHTIDTSYSPIGCPIYSELNLQFHPTYQLFDTALFCPYQPLAYDGTTYPSTGDYTIRRWTTHDCDSTTHIHLAIQDSGFRAAFEISDDGQLWNQDTMLSGCQPYRVLLHDLSSLASSSLWLINDNNTTTGDSISHLFDSTGTHSITLVSTSEHGCRDTASLLNAIWVFGSPTPEFTWAPQYPVTSHPSASFFNQTKGSDVTYLWSISNNNGYDTSSATQPSYTWGGGSELISGDYNVTLTALQAHLTPYGDTLRCPDSITHTITIVNDFLQFPNLVTPNGDGVNDTWEVVNLLECGMYTMNELWIYNAWGSLVYHVRNINRAEDFWNPAASRCPDGTYYFRFSAQSPFGLVRHTGTIEVISH